MINITSSGKRRASGSKNKGGMLKVHVIDVDEWAQMTDDAKYEFLYTATKPKKESMRFASSEKKSARKIPGLGLWKTIII